MISKETPSNIAYMSGMEACLHYVGPPGLAVDGDAGGGGLYGRHAPRPAHLAPVHALVQGQHRLQRAG